MNANELAEALKNMESGWFDDLTLKEAATMLRQQQAEIEALKQIIDANNLSQNIGQFVKPANEPVAWMDDCSFFIEQPDDMDGVTPLYTHPAKTLTDEEILEIAKENTFEFNEIPPIQFARAILKKASEK
jgi:hypothetical protein